MTTAPNLQAQLVDNPLPEFDAPPVVETAMSLQFARLSGFTTAHAGWFWKSHLKSAGGEWGKLLEQPRIPDQFEQPEGEPPPPALPSMKILTSGESQRLQLVRSDDERMIQIQDSRIILNWRKQSEGYPSYRVLAPDFFKVTGDFERFVADAKLGAFEPNQWEVTYVNQIPRGEMWDTPSDWTKIVPGLYAPRAYGDKTRYETMSGDWRFTLGEGRGRIYIAFRHGIVEGGTPSLYLNFTARGPIDASADISLPDKFELGHEAIVRTFANMTSESAHRVWQRRK
jgi:uncharacterized protein (TIGR04255 family)